MLLLCKPYAGVCSSPSCYQRDASHSPPHDVSSPNTVRSSYEHFRSVSEDARILPLAAEYFQAIFEAVIDGIEINLGSFKRAKLESTYGVTDVFTWRCHMFTVREMLVIRLSLHSGTALAATSLLLPPLYFVPAKCLCIFL